MPEGDRVAKDVTALDSSKNLPTLAIGLTYMNSGAGPTSDSIAPLPTNSPVPMAPPRARNLRQRSIPGRPTDPLQGYSLDVPRLQPTLELMLASKIDVGIQLIRVGDACIEHVVLEALRANLLGVVVHPRSWETVFADASAGAWRNAFFILPWIWKGL